MAPLSVLVVVKNVLMPQKNGKDLQVNQDQKVVLRRRQLKRKTENLLWRFQAAGKKILWGAPRGEVKKKTPKNNHRKKAKMRKRKKANITLQKKIGYQIERKGNHHIVARLRNEIPVDQNMTVFQDIRDLHEDIVVIVVTAIMKEKDGLKIVEVGVRKSE